jgi:hypothetical protein
MLIFSLPAQRNIQMAVIRNAVPAHGRRAFHGTPHAEPNRNFSDAPAIPMRYMSMAPTFMQYFGP